LCRFKSLTQRPQRKAAKDERTSYSTAVSSIRRPSAKAIERTMTRLLIRFRSLHEIRGLPATTIEHCSASPPAWWGQLRAVVHACPVDRPLLGDVTLIV